MKFRFFFFLLLLLFTHNISAQTEWRVEKGDQFYYSLQYQREDLNLDSFFILSIVNDPAIDHNYIEYTENKLSEYLKEYLNYFVIPTSINIDNETEVDYIEIVKYRLYSQFKAAASYNQNGVIEIFQLYQDNIVYLEIVLDSPTRTISLDGSYIFLSLFLLVLVRKIKIFKEFWFKSR